MTFSLSQSIESVLESLEEGIRSFRGVLKQIVIDNAKQLVLSHPRDDIATYHPKLLELITPSSTKASLNKIHAKYSAKRKQTSRPALLLILRLFHCLLHHITQSSHTSIKRYQPFLQIYQRFPHYIEHNSEYIGDSTQHIDQSTKFAISKQKALVAFN